MLTREGKEGSVEAGFASGQKRDERALLGYMDREAAKAPGRPGVTTNSL